jgi:hypothetical protein
VFPTLPPFECAFKPSSHFFFSAPSSPHLVFFHLAGNPLQCDHPEKSLYFSTGQVTHYNVTNLKNPRIFLLGQVTHYNVITFEKSSYFFSPGQVTHYNVTTFEKSSYFSTGQVIHYDVTNLRNPRIFQSSSRSPGTIRPLMKFFAFFYHRAVCPKQFDPFQKPKKK